MNPVQHSIVTVSLVIHLHILMKVIYWVMTPFFGTVQQVMLIMIGMMILHNAHQIIISIHIVVINVQIHIVIIV